MDITPEDLTSCAQCNSNIVISEEFEVSTPDGEVCNLECYSAYCKKSEKGSEL